MADTGDIPSDITLGALQAVRRNAGDTDFEAFTPGTGSGTVTSIATGTGLTGGPITTTGTISDANTGVAAATYGDATHVPQIAVNAQGRITTASDVTITAGHTIQDEGTPLTNRANLNFVGTDVTVTDDSGNSATVVTITTPIIPINVYNETATADGVSLTYYLTNYAVPSTIRVYIDGIRQPASDDAAPTDTVIFDTPPDAGALLLFDYEMELV